MTVNEAALNNDENDDQRTPVVELDVDEISHQMAARLTNTLLGHWLYMKGQVPFPVNSLERMSSQRYSGDLPLPNSRLTRKRKEFLDAYDDLNSHLRTTFVALSTAYAHTSTHAFSSSSSSTTPPKEDETQQQDPIISRPKYRSAKVCLFLVMGSSFSLPKARVLLELNHFHVEKFGEWEFISRRALPMPSPSDGDDGDDESSSSTEDEDESHPEVGEEAKRNGDDDDNGNDDNRDTDSDTEEVDSRRFFSVPSTPCQTASFYTAAGSDDDSASDSDEPPDTPSSSGASECPETQEQTKTSPDTSLSEDDIKPDNHQSHFLPSNEDAAEDESLRNGERKLSKALLKFGEVLGFDDEIAPTRTYILLRAPRRFSHPTWIPRQNLTSTLDKATNSVLNVENNNAKKKKRANKSGTFGSGVPTVGFRIVCQNTTREEHAEGEGGKNNDDSDIIDNDENDAEGGGNNVVEEELDELIWWSWDGRLVGFSD